ncbi:hypothetical protein FG386_003410 [Cryptosporidium ryanae]|uniref:uncharacterized protein n=1 Tax=Cryptosporidium ryanae TaxID=515981 RepID=UPI00351A4B67|nr:hypothetical protein FG386_003410 [Cryptosporidium ryanae]
MSKIVYFIVNLLIIRFFLRIKYALSNTITEFAINDGFIFSDKSLKLVECTYEVIPSIIRGIIGNSNPNEAMFDSCMNNGNFKRSIIGLAMSFTSGDDLKYNKIKCPRIIAAFQRDRILGYSCPYLSEYSELFSFSENKEFVDKRTINEKEGSNIRGYDSKKENKLPTILTSIYRKLLQSCDMIQYCLNNKINDTNSKYILNKKMDIPESKITGDGGTNHLSSFNNFFIHQTKLKEEIIGEISTVLPTKIGRMDIIRYSNELLRRLILEYEISTEKISPFDPFWLIQAYRMLLIYSILLEVNGIFVNINSYYFKKVLNYLSDNQPLRNIDSLQLKTKYMSLDNESKNQLLFLRASYTILESCFSFWEDLHSDYISKLLNKNNGKLEKNKYVDYSQICQNGLQLPLRQTKIFFYYAGIKVSVKCSDSHSNMNIIDDISLDSTELTEPTSNTSEEYNWYDTNSGIYSNSSTIMENSAQKTQSACSVCSFNTSPYSSKIYECPWFTRTTNISSQISTIEDYISFRNREITSLINQSLLINNPKATVLNLNKDILSGYYVGGGGSMMYRSCKYYIKKLYKKGDRDIILAQVVKLTDGQYKNIGNSEKIRYFCWYTAKLTYPNDPSFEKDYKRESEEYKDDRLEVFQSKFRHQSSPISTLHKKIDYKDLNELESIPNFSFSSAIKDTKKKAQSTFLEERRNSILKRLHPRNQEMDLKTLEYSVSEKNYELEKIPIIKKYSGPGFQCKLDTKLSSSKKPDKDLEDNVTDDDKSSLMPKLLQEIKLGVKLKPTGSMASREIMESVKREITSEDKNVNLGISSSQIKEEIQNSEFTPPVVETALLDEVTSNNKILFEME